MPGPRKWVLLDIPTRRGYLYVTPKPCVGKLCAGPLVPAYMARKYSLTGTAITMYFTPMLGYIKRGESILVSVAARVSGAETMFSVHIKLGSAGGNPQGYLSTFVEPFHIVEGVYKVRPMAPTLGTTIEGIWLGITPELPDMGRIGEAYSVWLREVDDKKKFTPEALQKANDLLEQVCKKHKFNVTPTEVTKGTITISRSDVGFRLGSTFRCLTSDFQTPKDDQVSL